MSCRAREVDNKTADEIKISLATGVLTNPNNENFHRMSRNNQRLSKSIQKAKENNKRNTATADLRERIENLTALRRETLQELKDLKEDLAASGASKSGKRDGGGTRKSDSSGRVLGPSKARGKAREMAEPYPMGWFFANYVLTYTDEILSHTTDRARRDSSTPDSSKPDEDAIDYALDDITDACEYSGNAADGMDWEPMLDINPTSVDIDLGVAGYPKQT
jgi:hypothetical protein